MTDGVTASGGNWMPPFALRSRNLDDPTADLLNSMMASVERANKIDMGRPGYHLGTGFYETSEGTAAASVLKIILLDDALLPGTYDLPGIASGKLMAAAGSGRLAPTGTTVDVVNYSTSIYAPIGGLVLAQTALGVLVAIWSAS